MIKYTLTDEAVMALSICKLRFSHHDVLFCLHSYIQYSNIAAKIVRRVLKPEFKADAAKREDSHVRFTAWKDGKPESKYTLTLSFILQ